MVRSSRSSVARFITQSPYNLSRNAVYFHPLAGRRRKVSFLYFFTAIVLLFHDLFIISNSETFTPVMEFLVREDLTSDSLTALSVLLFVFLYFLVIVLFEASYHIEQNRGIRFILMIMTFGMAAMLDHQASTARRNYKFGVRAGLISLFLLEIYSMWILWYSLENEVSDPFLLYPMIALGIQFVGLVMLTTVKPLFKLEERSESLDYAGTRDPKRQQAIRSILGRSIGIGELERRKRVAIMEKFVREEGGPTGGIKGIDLKIDDKIDRRGEIDIPIEKERGADAGGGNDDTGKMERSGVSSEVERFDAFMQTLAPARGGSTDREMGYSEEETGWPDGEGREGYGNWIHEKDEEEADGGGRGEEASKDRGGWGQEIREGRAGQEKGKVGQEKREEIYRDGGQDFDTAEDFLNSLDIIDPIEASRAAYRAGEEKREMLRERKEKNIKSTPNEKVLLKCTIASELYAATGVILLLLMFWGNAMLFRLLTGKTMSNLGGVHLFLNLLFISISIVLVVLSLKAAMELRIMADLRGNHDFGYMNLAWLLMYAVSGGLDFAMNGRIHLAFILPLLGLFTQMLGITYINNVQVFYRKFLSDLSVTGI